MKRQHKRFLIPLLLFVCSFILMDIQAGAVTITFGPETTYRNASQFRSDVIALDSTYFVVVYTDSGDGFAIVGERDGLDVNSYGTRLGFPSGVDNLDFLRVAALDSTHFVAAYRNTTDSNKGYAVIGVTSGTTISSFGAAVEFGGGGAIPESLALPFLIQHIL